MRLRLVLLILCGVATFCGNAVAQTFPRAEYFKSFLQRPRIARTAPTAGGFDQYISDGKLHLTLAEAVQLMLANNTDVRINKVQLDLAEYAVLRSFGPFDPVITTSFAPTRTTFPANSQLQGAPVVSSLTQSFSSAYSQVFQTGTQYSLSFVGNKNATNSSYSFFNPTISSTAQIAFAQPLLRNRGRFVNRAPIVIAQRNLSQSRANFETQLNDGVLQLIEQYWDVVQGKQNLTVLRGSLTLAEATYKQNKRALELGAISPLDIYRSEQQVAQRKLELVQAEYQSRQQQDAFRRTIGADLDPQLSAMELDLEESSEPVGELPAVDVTEALKTAMQSRPELNSLQQQLANAETNIRVANNAMKPDLTVGTFYASNGIGGNQIDGTTGQPVVISRGGLLDSFGQLSTLDYPTYGFTVQLNLPLRNRRAEADLGSSLAQQRRTVYQERQLEQAITLEVKNAVNQLDQAKLSIDAAKLTRDLAQKNLQAEQRKYELGVDTIFFVLDAQTQLAIAEQNLIQSQIAYQRALAAVDHARGSLLSRYSVRVTN
jgi:outer membrane protein